ncbi:MAG: phosphate signaling complex protein PhoU [Candidatus Thermoplasmatota archaeon]|nr:phosphate signaling complex protein PhoU [Candidatus Thermoplasmatota archaeon]
MVEKFHDELKELKKNVLEMGYLAKDMLHRSVEALKNQDLEMAQEILSLKEEIETRDSRIEDDALRLIALYQPMAKDMRTIGCCLKMITYLTRIGRYGKDIANVTKDLAGKQHIAKLVSIPYMEQKACEMIGDALTAFETENLDLIADFEERDDDVDALRYSIFRECISYMMEDTKNITQCAHYIMVSRYIERCADHACKMAEKIHYMVTGERAEIK